MWGRFSLSSTSTNVPDGVLRKRYLRSVNDVIDVIHLSRTPDDRTGSTRRVTLNAQARGAVATI
jgi:hypothetical protein